MRAFIAGVGVSLAMLSGAAQAASEFSNILVFGDSLSDNGNIPKLFGINVPAPPYYMNRFSNGPVYAEYLNGLLSVPAGNFTDYAIGGAQAGTGNIGGLPNAGVSQEIDRYLATNPHPGARDLTVVWAGANDYFGALPGIQALPTSQQTAALQTQVNTTVGNIVADVTRLAQAGVTNFVVPNLPNLGATPDFNTSPTNSATATQISTIHNQLLPTALAALQAQYHVNIIVVDVSALNAQVLADPTKFGVTNTTQQCLLNAACVAQKLPYLFWDGVHPTEQSHALLAQYFASTIDAPTVVGAQGELAIIAIQNTFDAITSRTQALRDGASGLLLSDLGGTGGGSGIANPDKPFAAFVSGTHGWGKRDDRTTAAGFNYTADNVYAGLDYRITPNLVAGGLFGYGTTKGDLHGSMGEADLDSYQGALYATYFQGGFYGTLGGTYVGDSWGKLNRNTFVVGEVAAATSQGRTAGLKFETGYVFDVGGVHLGPVGEVRYANIRIDGYSESGADGMNQQVDHQNFDTLVGAFGGQLSFTAGFGEVSLSPHLRVTYDHEFKDGPRDIITRLVSQPLLTNATLLDTPARDSVRIGGGVDIGMGANMSALVDFNATTSRSDGNDYQATAKLRLSF
ncbi:exported lipase [Aliidongia dinghuensis]|uniref:Exported lipase n=1 Tax=Aliidongia dinghuensis TaxID=1867774 RepID=A0A8J3E7N2_9PROT|nr:autotransporter domain-containing protein [Aliidongia dinghuensis]GGF45817.1 exported lipase [Aliidongia dinghuensis]